MNPSSNITVEQAAAKWEQDQARRMLAADTLNSASTKASCDMLQALGTVLDCELVTTDDKTYTKRAYDELCRLVDEFRGLFANVIEDRRRFDLHVRARTLVQEIAVHRETAFWLLPKDGMLAVEKLIHRQLQAYEDARTAVRILQAKDFEIAIPSDPAAVPPIPPNPYFGVTHPEFVS